MMTTTTTQPLSFLVHPRQTATTTTRSRLSYVSKSKLFAAASSNSNDNDNDEINTLRRRPADEDDYDHFDPRISPHQYPHGIDGRQAVAIDKDVDDDSDGDETIIHLKDTAAGSTASEASVRKDKTQPPQASKSSNIINDSVMNDHPLRLLHDEKGIQSNEKEEDENYLRKPSSATTTTSTTTTKNLSTEQQQQQQKEHSSPLLFDPTLSPHLYSNGTPTEVGQIEDDDGYKDEDCKNQQQQKENASPLFFDPTLSPHLYSKGTPKEVGQIEYDDDYKDADNQKQQQEKVHAPPHLFDPTLSPHLYTNGTPKEVGQIEDDDIFKTEHTMKKKTETIGILVVDHGSRNEASNRALEDLARAWNNQYNENNDDDANNDYDSSPDQQQPTRYYVQAAHMELASPTIKEGLQQLLQTAKQQQQQEDMHTIVVHPYFLSEHGRHVSQDIPALLEQALQELAPTNDADADADAKVSLPKVVLSKPLGTKTTQMWKIVQNLVQDTLEEEDQVQK